jgi:hypothetical protein
VYVRGTYRRNKTGDRRQQTATKDSRQGAPGIEPEAAIQGPQLVNAPKMCYSLDEVESQQKDD